MTLLYTTLAGVSLVAAWVNNLAAVAIACVFVLGSLVVRRVTTERVTARR